MTTCEEASHELMVLTKSMVIEPWLFHGTPFDILCTYKGNNILDHSRAFY